MQIITYYKWENIPRLTTFVLLFYGEVQLSYLERKILHIVTKTIALWLKWIGLENDRECIYLLKILTSINKAEHFNERNTLLECLKLKLINLGL